MATLQKSPGIRFESASSLNQRSVLRSDIAGFIGRTHRGPLDRCVRIEGFREYCRVFGELDDEVPLSYSIRGYFENGGEIAYVRRVASNHEELYSECWQIAWRRSLGLKPLIAFVASSPGSWAKGMKIRFWSESISNSRVRLFVQIKTSRGEHERFSFEFMVEDPIMPVLEKGFAQSALVRPRWICAKKSLRWRTLFANCEVDREFSLDHTWTDRPPLSDLIAGLDELMDEPEIAIVALSEIEFSADGTASRLDPAMIFRLAEKASRSNDRMLILDHDEELLKVVEQEKVGLPENVKRCMAMYGPRLKVQRQPGNRCITVSATGHVAGVIARVDRQQGAFHTPANTHLLDAIDIAETSDPRTALVDTRVNPIRCSAGRGLQLWGGRTLDPTKEGRHIAHRRFIHRLVRAIRRVAEPMVFESNTPELRRMFVRAITSVLLEAFRTGALIGERPDEAFYVKCDEKNNKPIDRENGFIHCDVGLALAVPMEFIVLKVSLSQDGLVEVFDS